MQPARGDHILNGVLEVAIDIETNGVLQGTVENEVTRAARNQFGNANFIMYCLPKGTGKSWIAYGYFQWWRTVYNDDWCGYMSANVHEIAHNIGLKHSNEGGGLYKDQSGMMGFSYRKIGRPSMCFNGHKYWLLGYMRNRHITLDLLKDGPWKGNLVAFVDYEETLPGEYTIIHVQDLYILYNRAKDFNRETVERFDQVTITKAADDLSDSIALGGIDGLSPVFNDQDITIQICSQQFGDKDIMEITIYQEELGQTSLCGRDAQPPPITPQPITSQPITSQPITPQPTKSPSRFPTPQPISPAPITESPVYTTVSPTPQPTLKPTTEGYCDDDEEATFLIGDTEERCVWLRHRPEMIQRVCIENSDPYIACPETCGACADHCEDTDNKYTFRNARRNCVWLQLRPEMIPEVCVPDSEAVRACPETCNICDAPKPTNRPSQFPSILPSIEPTLSTTVPTLTPSQSPTPLPTTQPTVSPSAALPSSRLSTTPSSSITAEPEIDQSMLISRAESPEESSSTYLAKCDDDYNTQFYVESLDRMEWCIWLSSRPNQQDVLCDPTHGSNAYFVCPETCGRCQDTCEDDPTTTFKVNNADRDCFWLSLRAHLVDELCVEGSDAYNGCAETCNVCDKETPMVCDDDPVATVYVASHDKYHPCIWLAARPAQIDVLCQPNNPAYHVCAETCGKCQDTCYDDESSFFHINGILRDCLWLSLRPHMQATECKQGKDAWTHCKETCENCGVIEVSRSDNSEGDDGNNDIQIEDLSNHEATTVCDDSKTARFYVEGSNEPLQSCVWLAARPGQIRVLCEEGHPEGVRHICRETCGTCTDDCTDSEMFFEYNNSQKNCLWLSLRYDVQKEICKPGQPAYLLCPETCDACDS